jgi:hypothetical protein
MATVQDTPIVEIRKCKIVMKNRVWKFVYESYFSWRGNLGIISL